jgi:hypothetical protein
MGRVGRIQVGLQAIDDANKQLAGLGDEGFQLLRCLRGVGLGPTASPMDIIPRGIEVVVKLVPSGEVQEFVSGLPWPADGHRFGDPPVRESRCIDAGAPGNREGDLLLPDSSQPAEGIEGCLRSSPQAVHDGLTSSSLHVQKVPLLAELG